MPPDLTALEARPWLCEPANLRRLAAGVLRVPSCPSGRELVAERARRLDLALQVGSKALGGPGAGGRGGPKVGVIPVYGPVEQRLTAALDKAGGTSLEEVSLMFDVLMDDPSVGSVVLHFDSPGGSSFGTEELSDKIYAARRRKPVYSVCDSLMCSAAFWVGTAAGHVSVTPGGDVGSVGVYCVHVDESKALDEGGITVTIVSAGEHKAELASTKPLGDSARQFLQESVDETYRKFVAAVARNRGVPESRVLLDYGRGRTLSAAQALAVGAVDAVQTFEQLMASLLGQSNAQPGSRTAKSLEMLALDNQRRKRKAVAV